MEDNRIALPRHRGPRVAYLRVAEPEMVDSCMRVVAQVCSQVPFSIDMRTKYLLLLMLAGPLVACEAIERVGVADDFEPRNLDGGFTWVLERWNEGAPVGHPEVRLSWDMPARFDNHSFRVYSRSTSGGGYFLIGTTTSCIGGSCHYADANIESGWSYDYYIATVDERSGQEVGASDAIRIAVPQEGSPPVPGAPIAVALDNAVYLTWAPVAGAQRYMVLSSMESGANCLIGETDGTGFFDDRAENGTSVTYTIAAVDVNDRVGRLSPTATAYPRPDYHAEIVHVHADSPQSSGFRFVPDPMAESPILSGSATNAQWRLTGSEGVLRIEPLGQTQVTAGVFTTALSCGPGAEPDCVDVRTAPPADSFNGSAVPALAGRTYVFRLVDGTAVRYAKIRVQGAADNTAGRLIVFDWAYQTRINEPAMLKAGS